MKNFYIVTKSGENLQNPLNGSFNLPSNSISSNTLQNVYNSQINTQQTTSPKTILIVNAPTLQQNFNNYQPKQFISNTYFPRPNLIQNDSTLHMHAPQMRRLNKSQRISSSHPPEVISISSDEEPIDTIITDKITDFCDVLAHFFLTHFQK